MLNGKKGEMGMSVPIRQLEIESHEHHNTRRRKYHSTRQATTRKQHAELKEAKTFKTVHRRRAQEEVLNQKKIFLVFTRIVDFLHTSCGQIAMDPKTDPR
jgi:hypothetical protein